MSKNKKKAPAKAEKKNNTKLRDTFAQVLDEKIAKAGFSIAELAEISDIAKSQLYDYKKALKSPTTDALDALAGAFKCDPADFLKPGAVAKRSGKPTAKPAKSSKAPAKPVKSVAPAKKSPTKPKGKKHQARASITITIPTSKSAAPVASSSDVEPAASEDTNPMADTSTALADTAEA